MVFMTSSIRVGVEEERAQSIPNIIATLRGKVLLHLRPYVYAGRSLGAIIGPSESNELSDCFFKANC
jgi:hypothetical protein